MTKNYPTWSIYVLLVCGVTTFLFGMWLTYRVVTVNMNGSIAEGTIIEYHSKPKNPQSITSKGLVHSPTFSYVTKSSIKYTLRSSVYEEDKTYEIGEKVKVKYDSENPKKAYITDRFPWATSVSLMVFGLLSFKFCVVELKKRL